MLTNSELEAARGEAARKHPLWELAVVTFAADEAPRRIQWLHAGGFLSAFVFLESQPKSPWVVRI